MLHIIKYIIGVALLMKGVQLMGKDLKGKELGSGIYQRKNGSYCARYVDRYGVRKSIYDKDLRELNRKLKIAEGRNAEGKVVKESSMTLEQWYQTWMFIYKEDLIKPNTKVRYMNMYEKHIKPTLGNKVLSKITKVQCMQLLKHLKEKGLGWESQNSARIMLVDMFNRALEDDFVLKSPMKGVRLATNKPENEPSVLTVDEQTEFFECCAGTWYNNAFVVAVNTGLRPGELFALTWNDIDLEKKEINVDKTLLYSKLEGDEKKTFHIDDPKTRTSTRKVPINSICEKALKKQYMQKKVISDRYREKETKFSDRLFVTKFNTPLNVQIFNEAIDRIVKEINLMKNELEQMEKFTGHSFRHTFATRCIESGIQPKTLQKYLGHATLQMTMDLYVHTTDEHKQEEMKKLESSLENLREDEQKFNEKFEKEMIEDNKIVTFASRMA